jgi:quercetin dioxygenase-like cupin family protein
MTNSKLGPESIEWLGTQYRMMLTSAATNGTLAVFESISPAGSGPPRHIHHAEDETFVLMTGRCEFWMDGKFHTEGPGATVFVPRGTPHTFKVIGDEDCRHLTILSPGGFEGFFAEMVRGSYRIPEDMARISEIAAQFNLSFVGPPL